MSVMPAPGLVIPSVHGLLADGQHDHDGRGDGADDLGDDVGDALDDGRSLVEDHRDGHGRVEVPAGDAPEREDRGQQAEPERERHDQEVRRRLAPSAGMPGSTCSRPS